MSFIRQSKYRHVWATPYKPEQCYQNLRVNFLTYEACNHIAGNQKFFAVPWQAGGGGAVYVGRHDQPGKADAAPPCVNGHRGPVIDVAFNPFNDHLLTTSCDDSIVRLFILPEEGVKDHINEASATLEGHGKKVHGLSYHPSANNVLATTSYDHTVKIWDVQATECKQTIEGHPDIILSCEWNHDGSQMLTTNKDKNLRIVDPRTAQIVSTVHCHDGAKGARALWLGSEGKILSVGSSKMSERQWAIWDPRNLEKPIGKEGMDVSTGTFMPFYDDDTKMVYLVGKGDANIRYFEVTEKAPYLFFLSQYQAQTPQAGACMLPKYANDVSKCEVARILKLTKNMVEPLQFCVPRKSEQFQEDIFPDTAGPQPAISADDYFGGKNAEPKKISMKPGSGAVTSTSSSFTAVKSAAVLQKELDAANARIKELEAEVARLKA